MEQKYGEQNVTCIGTYGTLKIKAALKDLCRYYGLDFKYVNYISSIIPPDLDFNNLFRFSAKDNNTLKQFIQEYPHIIEKLPLILEQAKNTGMHAAGVVITPHTDSSGNSKNIYDWMPVRKTDGVLISEWEGAYIDQVGFLKCDILGIKQLDKFDFINRIIFQNTNQDLRFDDISLNDREVFLYFHRGWNEDVFQFGAAGLRGYCQELQPDTIEDLIATVALYRPGPMEIGAHKDYIRLKNGLETPNYDYGTEKITKDTFGLLCIAENSKVKTNKGEKCIENVKIGDFILTEDGTYQKVINTFNKGIKDTLKIRTSFGEELICTHDHKILTQDGWKEASTLIKRDIIKAFWTQDLNVNIGTDKDWLIGIYLADGINKGYPTILCNSFSFAEVVGDIVREQFPYMKNVILREYHNGDHIRWYVEIKPNSELNLNDFQQELDSVGLIKDIDTFKSYRGCFSLSIVVGIMEAGSYFVDNHNQLNFPSAQKDLAYSVYCTLQEHHIWSSIYKDPYTFNWCVKFEFDKQIEDLLRISNSKLKFCGTERRVPKRYVPKVTEATEKRKFHWNNHFIKHKRKRFPYIELSIAEMYCDHIPHKEWGQITKISENAALLVYDLSVENIHSFVVGGLVVSNCYQEEIIKIVEEVGGLTETEADDVRKCIHKDTLFYTKEEGYISISNLDINKHTVLTLENDVNIFKKLSNVWCVGFQDCIRLTTEEGNRLICTSDHRVWGSNDNQQSFSWIEAKDTLGCIIFSDSSSEFGHTKVHSIEAVGRDWVWDFTMEDQETPRAYGNGLLIHNSMGKKDKILLDKYKSIFIDGAIKNNCPPDEAVSLWNKMEGFGSYAFNRCWSGQESLYRASQNKSGKSVYYPTIGEMYNIKNSKAYAKSVGKISLHDKYKRFGYPHSFSLNEQGRLIKNKVVDIRYEGKKDIYKVTVESGKVIRVTMNHKFPTNNGEKQLQDINVKKDLLYVNDGFYQKDTMYRWHLEELKEGEIKNANYTKWRELYAQKLDTCELCNKTDCKIEMHHKDGNHGNNVPENVISLCVSCHKKEEYKIGRTKIGEAGLHTVLEKIISIKWDSFDDIYDVEMAAPYHTITSKEGIVASNSHAVCYAITGYYSQWFKVHYPLAFWATSLQFSNEDEIQRRISEINRTSQIKLYPVDINKSKREYETDFQTNSIYWSLLSVKYLGEKALLALYEIRKEGEIYSLSEFLSRAVEFKSVLNKRIILNLILSGAFDQVESITSPVQRIDIILTYFKCIGKKITEDLLELTQWIEYNFILKQKELTGYGYIDYKKVFKSLKQFKENEYRDVLELQTSTHENKVVPVIGIVTQVVQRKSKNGPFCQIEFNCNSEIFYVTCWSETYESHSKDIHSAIGKIAAINGRLIFDANFKKTNVIHTISNTKFEVL